MGAFLCFIAVRLLAMRRVLKPTGSIYLHCDHTASHYLKLLMDAIFDKKNFRNEIIWCYNVGGKGKRWWARKHDVLLFYTKTSTYHFDGKAVGIERDTGTKSFGGRIGGWVLTACNRGIKNAIVISARWRERFLENGITEAQCQEYKTAFDHSEMAIALRLQEPVARSQSKSQQEAATHDNSLTAG